MKWFILVILLISCSKSLPQSCIYAGDTNTLKYSLDTFVFEQLINDVENYPYMPHVNEGPCNLQVYINYSSKELTLILASYVRVDTLNDQDIEIQTNITMINDNMTSVEHRIDYSCSYEKCELDFIMKNIPWLLDAKYSELTNKLLPLMVDSAKELKQCMNTNGTVEECLNGQCTGLIMGENAESNNISHQSCEHNMEIPTGFYYTAKSNLKSTEFDFEYQFYCQYDQCNDKDIIENAIKIFVEEYDIQSILEKFRNHSNYEQEIIEPTVNIIKSSTAQQQTELAQTTSMTKLFTSHMITTGSMTTVEPNRNGGCIQRTITMIYINLMMFIIVRFIVFK